MVFFMFAKIHKYRIKLYKKQLSDTNLSKTLFFYAKYLDTKADLWYNTAIKIKNAK